jgi:hypothetical protein
MNRSRYTLKRRETQHMLGSQLLLGKRGVKCTDEARIAERSAGFINTSRLARKTHAFVDVAIVARGSPSSHSVERYEILSSDQRGESENSYSPLDRFFLFHSWALW